MDEIIGKILESEKLAQRIIDEARQEKESHDSDIMQEIEKHQYEAHKNAWARVNKYAEELKAETSAEVARIEKAARDQVLEMRRRTEAGKEEWTELVFGRILSDSGDIG